MCSDMTPHMGANRNLNTHVQGVQVSITGTNRQEHTSYPTWTTNREHGCSLVRETPCFGKGISKSETWECNFDLYFLFLQMSTRWQWRASNQEPVQEQSRFFAKAVYFSFKMLISIEEKSDKEWGSLRIQTLPWLFLLKHFP